MITDKQEILDLLDRLEGLNCLLDCAANSTTGDDIKGMQCGLYFLSEELYNAINKLKNSEVFSHVNE